MAGSTVDSERQIFEKLFIDFFLPSEFLPDPCFDLCELVVLMSDLGFELSSTSIHYLLDCSDFNKVKITYIIGHYNPSVRIIDLLSHTTYFVCINFIHKWRDLQFKVDSE